MGIGVMQTKNEVFLEQSAYTKALLSRFGMDKANSVATPVDVYVDLVTTSDEVEECDKNLYQSVVDSLFRVNHVGSGIRARVFPLASRFAHQSTKLVIKSTKLVIVYCPSKDMLADIFTKGLSAEKFSRLRRKLGVVFFEKHIQCEKEC
ncbi:hypothetical protein FHG87_018183 [Trinorchestia longiramus]|nr:hypothetical protein FHG87_018183 [Trinorchestia longiramus]